MHGQSPLELLLEGDRKDTIVVDGDGPSVHPDVGKDLIGLDFGKLASKVIEDANGNGGPRPPALLAQRSTSPTWGASA
jgi:hypothetical protein